MLHDLPETLVSRETQDKLGIYKALLLKWQKAINLVAPSTIADANIRHFDDSLQISVLVPRETKTAIDIGSGGGFPAMVLAAELPNIEYHLIESDQRKCQFLNTISREANIPVTIHNDRVQNVDIPAPDLITARALANLQNLLELTEKWWSVKGDITLIFLKGNQASIEIDDAKKLFSFYIEQYQSKTDVNGRILKLTRIKRIA